MSAVAGGTVTHPVDLVKVRLQLLGSLDGMSSVGAAAVVVPKSKNVVGVGYHVVKTEGAQALFKGLSASMMRQVVFIGTKFGAYEVINGRATAYRGGRLSFAEKTACGLTAGAIGGIVGNPCDLAMVRMQADGRLPAELRRGYRNGATALASVVREEGVFTLWRGCGPTITRAMVVTASQLAVYDQAKEVIAANTSVTKGPVLHLSASSVAGIVASLTSNPIDLAKSRLQNMKADSAGKLPYKNTFHCLYKTMNDEGVLALYKGLDATIARQLPLNIVRFLCMEQLRTYFAKF